ncbi:hypothetical protein ACHAXH_009959 [Discostella pseudostelligera]
MVQQTTCSVELDLKFKMDKSISPLSSTDDECSSISFDEESQANDSQDDIIRKRLTACSYHLPGNTFCQDLSMYIRNNHQIFGICCHHRLHPIKAKHRLVILLGSLAFGLSATNAVYLYYLWGTDGESNDSVFSISLDGDIVETLNSNHALTIDISQGMALLWTVGAAAHTLFDMTLWYMIACPCTKKKCCRVAGWNMVVSIVMLTVAATSFVVVVRAYESGENDESDQDIKPAFGFGNEKADFRYMYGYLIELAISLLVYTPVMQTILFSGIMGCCTVPVFGGREYEVRKCKRELIRNARDLPSRAQGV